MACFEGGGNFGDSKLFRGVGNSPESNDNLILSYSNSSRLSKIQAGNQRPFGNNPFHAH